MTTNFLRKASHLFGSADQDGESLLPDPDYAKTSRKTARWQPPDYTKLYSTIKEPLIEVQPVLWFHQRSGSRTLMDILSYCGKMVLSSDMADGYDQREVSQRE